MKAKAALFMGAKRPFEIKEYEVTDPKKGMVRLNLLASGIWDFSSKKTMLKP